MRRLYPMPPVIKMVRKRTQQRIADKLGVGRSTVGDWFRDGAAQTNDGPGIALADARVRRAEVIAEFEAARMAGR